MADRPGIEKGESLMSMSFIASDGSFRIESSASLVREEFWSFPDMPLMYSSDQGVRDFENRHDRKAEMTSKAWMISLKDLWLSLTLVWSVL